MIGFYPGDTVCSPSKDKFMEVSPLSGAVLLQDLELTLGVYNPQDILDKVLPHIQPLSDDAFDDLSHFLELKKVCVFALAQRYPFLIIKDIS